VTETLAAVRQLLPSPDLTGVDIRGLRLAVEDLDGVMWSDNSEWPDGSVAE
jgi:hypothetical protein